jgi:hypothetical protein
MYNCCVDRYKRIFSIGSKAISTYNPTTLEVTNQWFYNDFISVCPTLKGNNHQNREFKITVRQERKTETMTFSSEHRADLLTEALQFQQFFAEKTAAMLVSMRVAPKLMPPIYFHGNYNTYKEHNNTTKLQYIQRAQ